MRLRKRNTCVFYRPMSTEAGTEEEQTKAKTQELLQTLINISAEYDLNAVLLATESLLVWRAASEAVPLQNLMDNLLNNIPTLYTLNLKAIKDKELTERIKV